MTRRTKLWLPLLLVVLLVATVVVAACTSTATVSFDKGATDATGTAPKSMEVTIGESIELPSNPFTRDGYTFDGWSDGNKTYAEGASYTVEDDVTFTATWKPVEGGDEHVCGDACPDCDKCTTDCGDPACNDKCPGHGGDEHVCEDKCPDCGGCLTDCDDPACEDKCPGHGGDEHVCEDKCPDCGGCLTDCDDPACADKCPGHDVVDDHECDNKCDECGGCLTPDCDHEDCADKCPGHESVVDEFVFGEETVAVANPGNMYYWNDHPDWVGTDVQVTESTVSNGTYTFTYSGATTKCWFGAQLFYKDSANVTGTTYTLTLVIDSSVAGSITVNGTVVELHVGKNEISVNYTEAGNKASLSIQFGVENPASVIASGTFTLSNIAFEEYVEHVHSFTAFGKDADAHWYYCPDDGEISNEGRISHVFDQNGATLCVCGQEYVWEYMYGVYDVVVEVWEGQDVVDKGIAVTISAKGVTVHFNGQDYTSELIKWVNQQLTINVEGLGGTFAIRVDDGICNIWSMSADLEVDVELGPHVDVVPEVVEPIVSELEGVWTNVDSTVIISTVGAGYYGYDRFDGSIIINGEFVQFYKTDSGLYAINSQYGILAIIAYDDGTITIEGVTYTYVSGLTHASVTDFVGSWTRTGTEQVLTVSESGVTLSSASNVTMHIVDKYLVVTYKYADSTCQYVLSVSGDQLVGYYTETGKAPVAVTFDKEIEPEPEVIAPVISELEGVWTNGTSTAIITTVGEGYRGYYYFNGSLIIDNEFMGIFATSTALYAYNSTEDDYTIVAYSDGTITINDVTYTRVSGLTHASRNDFVGSWNRTGTSQVITITDTDITFSLSSASDVTMYIVDNYLVVTYSVGYGNYQFLLTKSGNQLVGYYTVDEKAPVTVTFDAVVIDDHECSQPCPDCSGCLDPDCDKDACKDKCPGHETAEATTFTGNATFSSVKGTIVIKEVTLVVTEHTTTAHIKYTLNGAEKEADVTLTDGVFGWYEGDGTLVYYYYMNGADFGTERYLIAVLDDGRIAICDDDVLVTDPYLTTGGGTEEPEFREITLTNTVVDNDLYMKLYMDADDLAFLAKYAARVEVDGKSFADWDRKGFLVDGTVCIIVRIIESGTMSGKYVLNWYDANDNLIATCSFGEDVSDEPTEIDITAISGVWTSGDHLVVISTVGADGSYVGSIIIDGMRFAQLRLSADKLTLTGMDSIDGSYTIALDGNNITVNGTVYTLQTDDATGNVAAFVGSWKGTGSEGTLTVSDDGTVVHSTTKVDNVYFVSNYMVVVLASTGGKQYTYILTVDGDQLVGGMMEKWNYASGSVTFDKLGDTITINFAKSDSATGSMDSVDVASGEYTLPACGFVSNNSTWAFLGWIVGDNHNTLYKVGDKINVTEDTTLTAVFGRDYKGDWSDGYYTVVTIRDDGYLILDIGTTMVYTNEGLRYTVNYIGEDVTIEVNENAGTYVVVTDDEPEFREITLTNTVVDNDLYMKLYMDAKDLAFLTDNAARVEVNGKSFADWDRKGFLVDGTVCIIVRIIESGTMSGKYTLDWYDADNNKIATCSFGEEPGPGEDEGLDGKVFSGYLDSYPAKLKFDNGRVYVNDGYFDAWYNYELVDDVTITFTAKDPYYNEYYTYYVELDLDGLTFIQLDVMYPEVYTSVDGYELTFDGKGKAFLDGHEGTYELIEQSWYYIGFKVTFDGVTVEIMFSEDSDNPISAKIVIDGKEYVFGNASTEEPEPDTIDISEIEGVWTSGSHEIIISTVGANGEYVGSAIVDGKEFFLLALSADGSALQGTSVLGSNITVTLADGGITVAVTVTRYSLLSTLNLTLTTSVDVNHSASDFEGKWADEQEPYDSYVYFITIKDGQITHSDDGCEDLTYLVVDKYLIITYTYDGYYTVYVHTRVGNTLEGYWTDDDGFSMEYPLYLVDEGGEEPGPGGDEIDLADHQGTWEGTITGLSDWAEWTTVKIDGDTISLYDATSGGSWYNVTVSSLNGVVEFSFKVSTSSYTGTIEFTSATTLVLTLNYRGRVEKSAEFTLQGSTGGEEPGPGEDDCEWEDYIGTFKGTDARGGTGTYVVTITATGIEITINGVPVEVTNLTYDDWNEFEFDINGTHYYLTDSSYMQGVYDEIILLSLISEDYSVMADLARTNGEEEDIDYAKLLADYEGDWTGSITNRSTTYDVIRIANGTISLHDSDYSLELDYSWVELSLTGATEGGNLVINFKKNGTITWTGTITFTSATTLTIDIEGTTAEFKLGGGDEPSDGDVLVFTGSATRTISGSTVVITKVTINTTTMLVTVEGTIDGAPLSREFKLDDLNSSKDWYEGTRYSELSSLYCFDYDNTYYRYYISIYSDDTMELSTYWGDNVLGKFYLEGTEPDVPGDEIDLSKFEGTWNGMIDSLDDWCEWSVVKIENGKISLYYDDGFFGASWITVSIDSLDGVVSFHFSTYASYTGTIEFVNETTLKLTLKYSYNGDTDEASAEYTLDQSTGGEEPDPDVPGEDDIDLADHQGTWTGGRMETYNGDVWTSIKIVGDTISVYDDGYEWVTVEITSLKGVVEFTFWYNSKTYTGTIKFTSDTTLTLTLIHTGYEGSANYTLEGSTGGGEEDEGFDGTYLNPDGMTDLVEEVNDDTLNFTKAVIDGDNLILSMDDGTSQTVRLTWNGNVGTGKYLIWDFLSENITVTVEKGKITIVFEYFGDEYPYVFTKEGSTGGEEPTPIEISIEEIVGVWTDGDSTVIISTINPMEGSVGSILINNELYSLFYNDDHTALQRGNYTITLNADGSINIQYGDEEAVVYTKHADIANTTLASFAGYWQLVGDTFTVSITDSTVDYKGNYYIVDKYLILYDSSADYYILHMDGDTLVGYYCGESVTFTQEITTIDIARVSGVWKNADGAEIYISENKIGYSMGSSIYVGSILIDNVFVEVWYNSDQTALVHTSNYYNVTIELCQGGLLIVVGDDDEDGVVYSCDRELATEDLTYFEGRWQGYADGSTDRIELNVASGAVKVNGVSKNFTVVGKYLVIQEGNNTYYILTKQGDATLAGYVHGIYTHEEVTLEIYFPVAWVDHLGTYVINRDDEDNEDYEDDYYAVIISEEGLVLVINDNRYTVAAEDLTYDSDEFTFDANGAEWTLSLGRWINLCNDDVDMYLVKYPDSPVAWEEMIGTYEGTYADTSYMVVIDRLGAQLYIDGERQVKEYGGYASYYEMLTIETEDGDYYGFAINKTSNGVTTKINLVKYEDDDPDEVIFTTVLTLVGYSEVSARDWFNGTYVTEEELDDGHNYVFIITADGIEVYVDGKKVEATILYLSEEYVEEYGLYDLWIEIAGVSYYLEGDVDDLAGGYFDSLSLVTEEDDYLGWVVYKENYVPEVPSGTVNNVVDPYFDSGIIGAWFQTEGYTLDDMYDVELLINGVSTGVEPYQVLPSGDVGKYKPMWNNLYSYLTVGVNTIEFRFNGVTYSPTTGLGGGPYTVDGYVYTLTVEDGKLAITKVEEKQPEPEDPIHYEWFEGTFVGTFEDPYDNYEEHDIVIIFNSKDDIVVYIDGVLAEVVFCSTKTITVGGNALDYIYLTINGKYYFLHSSLDNVEEERITLGVYSVEDFEDSVNREEFDIDHGEYTPEQPGEPDIVEIVLTSDPSYYGGANNDMYVHLYMSAAHMDVIAKAAKVLVNGTYTGTDWAGKGFEIDGTVQVNVRLGESGKPEGTIVLTWVDANGKTIATCTIGSTTTDPQPTKGEWTHTNATLVVEDDKVYFVISGTHTNYEEEALKAELEGLYFDLQKRGGDYYKFKGFERVVSVDMGAGTWTIKFDITNQELHANPFTVHFAEEGDNGVGDLKLDTAHATDGHSVTLNGRKYTIVNKHGSGAETDNWGVVSVKIEEIGAPSIVATNASLELKDDKVYLVITANFANYSKEELETIVYFDDGDNKQITVETVEMGDGTVKLYFDFSNAQSSETGEWWFGHWSINGEKIGGGNADINCDVTVDAIGYVVNGRKITLRTQYNMPIVVVTDYSEPTEFTFTGATLQHKEGKVYLVLTAYIGDYTQEDLETITNYNDGGASLTVETVEISDKTATLYFNFTDVKMSDLRDGGNWYSHWTINGGNKGNLNSPVRTNTEGYVVNGKKFTLIEAFGLPTVFVTEVDHYYTEYVDLGDQHAPKCANCGYVDEGNAVDHVYDDGNCEAIDGTDTHALICDVCGNQDKTEGHDVGYEHGSEFGSHNEVCTKCDATLGSADCTIVLNHCDVCGYTYSVDEIFAAMYELGEGESMPGTYKLTGTITSITEISEQYKNSTFVMSVDGHEITVYRATGYDPAHVGDKATISGEIVYFHNNNTGENIYEFATGGTIEGYEHKDRTIDVDIDEAIGHIEGIESYTVKCGTEISFTIVVDNDSYKVGEVKIKGTIYKADSGVYTFTVEDDTEIVVTFVSAETAVAETATMAFSGSSNGNLTDDSSANAATVGLETKIFEVTSTKAPGYNTHVGLNTSNGGHIRLYTKQNVTLTITVKAGYVIDSIQVILVSTSPAKMTSLSVVGGTAVAGGSNTDTTYTVNGASVALSNTDQNNQIYISSIVIKYHAGEGVVNPDPDTDPKDPVDPNPSGAWTLVTDISKLNEGDIIIIVSGSKAAGTFTISSSNKYLAPVDITTSNNTIVDIPSSVIQFTLGKDGDGNWTLSTKDGLLGISDAGSNRRLEIGGSNTSWTFSITDQKVQIKNTMSGDNVLLQYNSSNQWFANYKSTSNQTDPQLYKLAATSTLSMSEF